MINKNITVNLLILWARIYLFIATNLAFRVIFSLCYNNFLFFMISTYTMEIDLTLTFIANNELKPEKIKDYANKISAYLQQVTFAIDRINSTMPRLCYLAQGGTAVGTVLIIITLGC